MEEKSLPRWTHPDVRLLFKNRSMPRHPRHIRRSSAALLGATLVCSACGGDREPYRPAVHKVYFRGVDQISAKDIRKKIAVQQSSWFPLAPKKRLAHPQAAEFDRERIVTYYQTRGFYNTRVPKAEVVAYKLDLKKDPASPEAVKSVDVFFTVEEGPSTWVTQVQIEGLENKTSREDVDYVRRRVTMRPGDVIEHEAYLETKDLILQRIRQRGYAFAKITESEIAVNREDQTAVVRIVVDPGKKVRLGQVKIKGTDKVDPAAALKHAGLEVGVPYKPAVLDEAQGRLFNTGLFTTVRVEPVQTLDEEIADVVITVAEGKRNELRVGVGVGIEPLRNEVHAEILYTQRRFLGGLRQLNLSLTPGYAAMPAVWANPIRRHGPILQAKAEMVQPDLIGVGSALTLTLGYELGIQYAYQYHGPTFRLGLSKLLWHDRINLAASYNFQYLDFFNSELQADASAERSSEVLFGFVDPYRLGFFQEQVALDLRDRKVDARRGVLLMLMSEQGGNYAGGAFSYQKLQPEVRAYYTIAKRLTVAARVQFGQIYTQGDLGSPITQRFYLGGPNSHRGFTFNRLSYQMCSGAEETYDPQSMRFGRPTPVLKRCPGAEMEQNRTPEQEIQDGKRLRDVVRLPTGGDQMLLAQLELRLGLFKLAGNWLTMAGFVDAGDVAAPLGQLSEEATKISLSRLHVAVGGGFRYNTVIGTIRFDLGVRLNRLETAEANGVENPDPGQRIAYHISIGESF